MTGNYGQKEIQSLLGDSLHRQPGKKVTLQGNLSAQKKVD
jgi:hypothetical protein